MGGSNLYMLKYFYMEESGDQSSDDWLLRWKEKTRVTDCSSTIIAQDGGSGDGGSGVPRHSLSIYWIYNFQWFIRAWKGERQEASGHQWYLAKWQLVANVGRQKKALLTKPPRYLQGNARFYFIYPPIWEAVYQLEVIFIANNVAENHSWYIILWDYQRKRVTELTKG